MFLLFSALLVPLFGLHHFVAAFKPDSEGSTKFAIEVISALTISFQVSVFEKKNNVPESNLMNSISGNGSGNTFLSDQQRSSDGTEKVFWPTHRTL